MKKKTFIPFGQHVFLLSEDIYHKKMEEHVNKIWRRSTSEREDEDQGIFITATEANVRVCCIGRQKQIVLRFILSQQQSRLSRRESCLRVCGGETQIMRHHGIKQSHKWGESKVQLSPESQK